MINNNLKQARNELEMTQEELGYIFGVKKAAISNWENGYDIIPLNKLIKFCNLFNFSPNYISGLSKENNISEITLKCDKKEIGIKLKNIRKSKNLTQQNFADICSISRATYCHYEIGMNLISTIALYTICKTFNISMDSFFK